MTPSEGPDEAADILAKGAAALEDLFARLRTDIAEARATIGGGTWSAKDLAGHMETWEQVALDTIEDLRAGRRPRLREVVTDEASLDRFNAAQVQAKASQSWEEALAALKATTASLVATVQAIPPQVWRATPLGQGDDRRTMGQHVGSATGMPKYPFRHAWAHLPDLRALVEAVEAQPEA